MENHVALSAEKSRDSLSSTAAHVPLSDDEVDAYITDPATIPTHDVAMEVLDVLEREIASIQAQVDAAQIEAQAVPLSGERQAWLQRACYAGAMRKNERHRVMQRDKELRGTKNRNLPKDPAHTEAKRLKHARLLTEVEIRRDSKKLQIEEQRTLQLKLAAQSDELRAVKLYQWRFVENAKRLLPEDLYRKIADASKDVEEREPGGSTPQKEQRGSPNRA